MSMINDFNRDCPLTIVNLEKWFRSIISELDKTFMIDASLLKGLYNKSVNADIASIINTTTFAAIVQAIEDGKELKCSDRTIGIAAAKCTCVTSDDYSSFTLVMFGVLGSKMQRIILETENLGGAMRLSKKTVIDL